MVVGVHDLQWYDHNAVRNYPLASNATRLDTSGTFTIPSSLIVGLAMPVHWGVDVDPSGFYLSKIEYFPNAAQLTISYTNGTTAVVAARSIFSFETHERNLSYDLIGQGTFRDTLGHVTIGDLSDLM
jgi:hypothetical protein